MLTICEGDIDYDTIISIASHMIHLNNCSSSFDWFNRPDHENIVDRVSRRTDLSDDEKKALIDNAYNVVKADESIVPEWVIRNNIKNIIWNDTTKKEKTSVDVAKYFGFDNLKRRLI